MKELSAALYVVVLTIQKVYAYSAFELSSHYLKIQKDIFPEDSEETILRRFYKIYLENSPIGFLVHDKTVEFISNLACILTNYTYTT